MTNVFKSWRKKYLNNPFRYMQYALGEILLIIIGILIAVSINEKLTLKKDNEFMCQYLQELNFAFNKDVEDVEINLKSLRSWNPHVSSILTAVKDMKLQDLDSLNLKIQVLANYVTFLQQSKSTIEELKYSNVNPISNRDLKKLILIYQESKITYLLDQQRRLNELNDKIMDYYLLNGPLDANELQNDPYFVNLIKRKYGHNELMIDHYDDLLSELIEMKALIRVEQDEKCGE